MQLRELLQQELGTAYALERELEGGGMSRVFVAEERRLGRKVVVKVLAPDLAEGISAERFAREIQVAARLQQANIVPVLTTGQAGPAAYYTMPFISGRSLRDHLRSGAMPLPLAVSVLRDVMRALAYAHAEGIVHRDVKPENVLLSGDTAVVTDFGIAKAIAASRAAPAATLTQLGTAIGTPAYMAPEQASGDEVDHRADLYSWGLLAYELLCGQHPFAAKASAQAYIAAQLVEIPAPLAARCPDCPPALARLVMRCLEKDPAQRPQTARAVLAEVDAAVTPSRGTPAPALERLRPDIVHRTFKLTDDVCRRVDRSLLDPRIIGGDMTWLDNGVASDTLVVCIHGTGLDGEMFRETLEHVPLRVVAPTFFGFEPQARRRVPLTVQAHMALLREFTTSVVAEVRPARTILLGFSSGGDVAMRLIAEHPAGALAVDAIVALGVNLALDTCWITRRLARVQSAHESGLLDDLKTIATSSATVDEWLNVHEYLVRVLRKFERDMEPLRLVSSGFARPFEEGDRDVFAAWYRAVTSRVPTVICVNEESDTTRPIVQELRLRNLDGGILGAHYREDSIVLEPDADHFDLLALPRVQRYLGIALQRLADR